MCDPPNWVLGTFAQIMKTYKICGVRGMYRCYIKKKKNPPSCKYFSLFTAHKQMIGFTITGSDSVIKDRQTSSHGAIRGKTWIELRLETHKEQNDLSI